MVGLAIRAPDGAKNDWYTNQETGVSGNERCLRKGMENSINEIREREVNDEIQFPIIINKDNQLLNTMSAAFHTWKYGVKS